MGELSVRKKSSDRYLSGVTSADLYFCLFGLMGTESCYFLAATGDALRGNEISFAFLSEIETGSLFCFSSVMVVGIVLVFPLTGQRLCSQWKVNE